jgi:hypothetical protein
VQSRKDYFPLKSSKFKLNLRANAQELTHQCGKNRSANVSGIDPPMFQEYSQKLCFFEQKMGLYKMSYS